MAIFFTQTAAETETPWRFGSYNELAPQLITKHFFYFFVWFNQSGIRVFVCMTQRRDLSWNHPQLFTSPEAAASEPAEKKGRKVDASAYLRTKNTSENAGRGPDTKALGCKILKGTPSRRRAKVIYPLNGGEQT